MKDNELNNYIALCHQMSVSAGWWDGLDDSILPTKLLLVYTEITEAGDGILGGDLFDDKIPEFSMEAAELADTAIRIFDYMGRRGLRVRNVHPLNGLTFPEKNSTNQRIVSLFEITRCVSIAVEGLRRGSESEEQRGLQLALARIFSHAKIRSIDLFKVIDTKLEFNSKRADHKPENRQKEGGKKF